MWQDECGAQAIPLTLALKKKLLYYTIRIIKIKKKKKVRMNEL